MVFQNALATVFRHAEANVGVHLVEFIEPRTVVRDIADIPAEVVVVGHQIGDFVHFTVHFDHRQLRHSRQAGFVELVAQIVEHIEVVKQTRRFAADGNFVGNAPANNRGVIVIL